MPRRAKTAKTSLAGQRMVPGAAYDTTPTPTAPKTRSVISTPTAGNATTPATAPATKSTVAAPTKSSSVSNTESATVVPVKGNNKPPIAAPTAKATTPAPKKEILTFDDSHEFSLHHGTKFSVKPSDLTPGYCRSTAGIDFKTAYEYLAYLHAVNMGHFDKSASMASLDIKRVMKSIDNEEGWTSPDDWRQFTAAKNTKSAMPWLEQAMWHKFCGGRTAVIDRLLATGEKALVSTSDDEMLGAVLRKELGAALIDVRQRLRDDKDIQDRLSGVKKETRSKGEA